MLFAGVSTRRVSELLERIIRLPVSAGQVSRLAKRLNAAVQAFHAQRLADGYVDLLLYPICLMARAMPRLVENDPRRSRKRAVLVAYGLTRPGIWQSIHFRMAANNS